MPSLAKRLLATLLLLAIPGSLPILVIAVCDQVISLRTRPLLFDSIDDCPGHPVALVLGCSPTVAGARPNRYFTARIDTAAALWHAGICRYLLVSGDNGRADYDEPTAMRDALVERGVPVEAVVRDHAGFDTLDSVVRAREIFGQRRLMIVSQRFHNERALYIARNHGIEAHALNAADVTGSLGMKTRIREKFARIKTMLDVHVLRSRPRYLGPLEWIAGTGNG